MGLIGHNPLLSDSEDEAAPEQQQQQQLQQQQQAKKRCFVDLEEAARAAKVSRGHLQIGDSKAGLAALSASPPEEAAAAAAAAGDSSITGRVVPEGAIVVLRDFSGKRSLLRAESGTWSSQFAIDPAVLPGSPYGSTFSWSGCYWRRTQRISGSLLQKVLDTADFEGLPALKPKPYCSSGSNKDIVDCGDSQRLGGSEIENLKARAGSAVEAIREVAANSSTFQQRTSFSKRKYIIKKAKRYIKQLTVLEPTLRELCEFYFESNPTKIIGLRHDYLSFLLQSLCLQPHHKVLLIDHALGAATAGVLLRLHPPGRLFRLTESGALGDKLLRELQLSPQELACLRDINVEEALNVLRERYERVATRKLAAAKGKRPPMGPPKAAAAKETHAEKAAEKRSQHQQQLHAEAAAALEEIEAAGGLDGFLAAVSPYKVRRKQGDSSSSSSSSRTMLELFHALLHKVLLLAFRFLKPGGRLVLFCQNFEAAGALHSAVCASKDFVDCSMTELLLRQMQVGVLFVALLIILLPSFLPRRQGHFLKMSYQGALTPTCRVPFKFPADSSSLPPESSETPHLRGPLPGPQRRGDQGGALNRTPKRGPYEGPLRGAPNRTPERGPYNGFYEGPPTGPLKMGPYEGPLRRAPTRGP
ncbi:hypothetical protein Efla_000110 [Eimeria flavescens]